MNEMNENENASENAMANVDSENDHGAINWHKLSRTKEETIHERTMLVMNTGRGSARPQNLRT